MATMTWSGGFPGRRQVWIDFHALRAAWLAHRRRRADRLALVRARLDSRLLDDMGIAPDEAKALVGDWEHLSPNGFLIRPRR